MKDGESVLPARYWVWQTFSGCTFRFDPAEAERIATRLDEWCDDKQTSELGFVRATDLAGTEVRLRIAHCDFFFECTPESRELDRSIRTELEAENRDWSEP